MKKVYLRSSEEEIHISFIEWLKLKRIPHWHTPNGGKRHAGEALKLKKMGTSAGVPDIFIPVPTIYHHGLFIELKSSTGKLTHAQRYWIDYLVDNLYCARVAYGVEEAIEIVKNYLTIKSDYIVKFT